MRTKILGLSACGLLLGSAALAQLTFNRNNWTQFENHSYGAGTVPPGFSCSSNADCRPTSAPGYAARSAGDCYPAGEMDPGKSFCERIDKNCSLPGTDGAMYGDKAIVSGQAFECYRPTQGSATWRKAGEAVSYTFQSCGYQATGLNVSCRNSQTGQSHAELLFVGDTEPTSCAAKLVAACRAVGYTAQQQGATVTIYGSGIVVQAVGPIFK